jgi:hypothetical protein
MPMKDMATRHNKIVCRPSLTYNSYYILVVFDRKYGQKE